MTNELGEYYFSAPSATLENWLNPLDSLLEDQEVIVAFGLDGTDAANNTFDPATEIFSVGDRDFTLTLSDQEDQPSGDDRVDSDAEIATAPNLPWSGFPTIEYEITAAKTDFRLDIGLVEQTVDLALTKVTNLSAPAMLGQAVEFDIRVINQGTKPIQSVTLNDYIGEGLVFDPADNMNLATQLNGMATAATASWQATADTATTVVTLPGMGLGQDDTLLVPIFLRITTPENLTAELYTNRAEIGGATDLQGQEVGGQDVDSTPDRDPDNDAGGLPGPDADNVTEGDGTGIAGGSTRWVTKTTKTRRGYRYSTWHSPKRPTS